MLSIVYTRRMYYSKNSDKLQILCIENTNQIVAEKFRYRKSSIFLSSYYGSSNYSGLILEHKINSCQFPHCTTENVY